MTSFKLVEETVQRLCDVRRLISQVPECAAKT